jgi:hypothetical protein
MTFFIVPIVEGHTEAGYVERLLQRVWTTLLGAPLRLQVLPPCRGKRDKLINPDFRDLAEKIEEAHEKLAQGLRRDPSGRGLLLLLLDAEGDCPAKLAPRLLEAAKKMRSDADISCILAKRMFENWIVAGASALTGVNDLPDTLPARGQFEDRSGAAWLDSQLRGGKRARKYKKTSDAEPFVRAMNLQECRDNCPSFDKLCRELEGRLLQSPSATPDQGPAPPAE